MTEAVTTEAPEVFPWEVEYTPGPDVHVSAHVLAAEPRLDYSPETYPSITIHEADRVGSSASLTLTLTGNDEQRHVVATRLRELADLIDGWVKP
jgi:hypothetical protein